MHEAKCCSGGHPPILTTLKVTYLADLCIMLTKRVVPRELVSVCNGHSMSVCVCERCHKCVIKIPQTHLEDSPETVRQG